MNIFQPKPKNEILAKISGLVQTEEQPILKPEGIPKDTKIYEHLVSLTLRGFEFLVDGERLTVRPASDLTPEEIQLLKEHKAEVIAWVNGIDEERKPARHIKAAIEKWLEEDEDSRIWAKTLPKRGEDYVKAQLWQVLAELRSRGILVPKDEKEVVVFLMMEVAWRLAAA